MMGLRAQEQYFEEKLPSGSEDVEVLGEESTPSFLEEMERLRDRREAQSRPIVKQSACRPAQGNTTPTTTCITETWRLFCAEGAEPETTCTVLGVRFREDTVIELSDIENLIVREDQMRCVTQRQEQCAITIRLTKPGPTSLRVLGGGTIEGQFIVIDSPETAVFIDSHSQIVATAASYAFRGSAPAAPARGASFVGQGGYCGAETLDYRVYGRFDMSNPANPWDPSTYQVGSMAQWSPPEKATSGGGYIYMNIDSTHFRGDGSTTTIQADGWPQAEASKAGTYQGGSGGYIHIKTTNVHGKVNNDNSDTQWRVSASGGDGKVAGFGGAGGIVILDGKFEVRQSNYQAFGGRAGAQAQDNGEGCGTGAAGTVFFKQQDTLFISNGNRKTDKLTQVTAAQRSSAHPNDNLIANTVWIEGGANVNIKNSNMDSVLFPQLTMRGASSLIFDFDNTAELTIKYVTNFAVDRASKIDVTKISKHTRFQASDTDDNSYVQLGEVRFSEDISILASDVELQARLVDPSETDVLDNSKDGRIIIISNRLQILQNVQLKAPNIFLYANESIDIMKGSALKSLKASSCNTDASTGWISDMYKCMSNDFAGATLDFAYFLNYYNQQYKAQATQISDMTAKITEWWNIYIMTHGKLTLQGTSVRAPKVGLCGGDITLMNSDVDTSWRGCPHDLGLGNLARPVACAGAGAAHGGSGGAGGVASTDPGDKAFCSKAYPQPHYNGKEAAYEGSGGTSGDWARVTGGAGGGIIWSHTPGTTQMNDSSLFADGEAGRRGDREQFGSGGGSGGSIQITTLNMVGDGLVSAMGGAGTANGGGGGAGGRFIMNYLKSYLSSSNPRQSYFWEGHHDVSGGAGGAMASAFQAGAAGELGTAYHSKCFPGYSGVFCRACPVGFYKYDYSFGECIPCINKPASAYYTTRGEDNSMCAYECNALRESSKYNKDCLDPISLEVQRLGGVVPFFALLGIFLVFSLILFSMLSYRSQQIGEEQKDLPEALYHLWEEGYTEVNRRGRTSQQDYSMNDDCVWSHTHRMYLIGSNTIKFPFFIPKDFPRDALKRHDREKFLRFIDEQNPKLQYTWLEFLSYVAVCLLYPPLANLYHHHLRARKFVMLQRDLYDHFPPQFWGDKGENKTIRLGVSTTDHMMAYIDFLDFSQTHENWQGLKLPMPVLLAGNGTFNSPYNVDFESDVYAKSLVLMKFDFFRDKLPVWLENFNTQLSKLSFFKLEVAVMRDLTNVVEWIEKANVTMFNHFEVKAVLYIVENQYTEVEGGAFKQKRRSFPLETAFFDAFPEMYLALIRYVKQRMISRKSEVRIALVFKKYTKTKQMQTDMRIRMMKEKDAASAYQLAINRQESVLFDDTDKDAEEGRVKFDKKKPSSLQSAAGSLSSLGSQTSLASEASGAGGAQGPKKPVKLVDKTRRAFSISIESSKAFELSIRKPRTKCKHYMARLKGSIHAIYLLLMKQQGSSPKSKDLTLFFVLYAGALALDFLLLLNYTLHLFMPASNFGRFGWAFFCFILGVPYFSPAVAFAAAFLGSPKLMKTMSNMNSYEIMVNIPLVAIVGFLKEDDPVYLLLLCFMVLAKMALSATSAKVRQYLTNPRYSKNADKLKKILKRQKEKLQKRDEILGREATQQLAGTNTGVPLGGMAASGSHLDSQGRRSSSTAAGTQRDEGGVAPALDQDTLRDMLLE